MVREELERTLEEILGALAPQLAQNPLAGLMLTQLRGYMRNMPEAQAEQIAQQIVRIGRRMEGVLRRKGVEV